MDISNPAYQAFKILKIGFIALPVIAGFDKFFHILGDWNYYLAPLFPQLFSLDVNTFMKGVGIVEIIAGIVVSIKPQIGAYIIAAWLWGIVVNLLILGQYYDVALRDFGLSLGALAFARLAKQFT